MLRYCNFCGTCWLTLCERYLLLSIVCVGDDKGAMKAISIHWSIHSSWMLRHMTDATFPFEVYRFFEKSNADSYVPSKWYHIVSINSASLIFRHPLHKWTSVSLIFGTGKPNNFEHFNTAHFQHYEPTEMCRAAQSVQTGGRRRIPRLPRSRLRRANWPAKKSLLYQRGVPIERTALDRN